MDLESGYSRPIVQNLSSDPLDKARALFDQGLIYMYAFHHEHAAKYFKDCLCINDEVPLVHALIAHCHSPNYNFFGDNYYNNYVPQSEAFPSQFIAERHSKRAVALISCNDRWDSIEKIIIEAIYLRTSQPGLSSEEVENMISRPYADVLKAGIKIYSNDADLIFFYAESLMVINAWRLFEYPHGRPLSPDVLEIQRVLEHGLSIARTHPGLCHLYIHLSEMSSTPSMALNACQVLRNKFPEAGHLLHMPTHIDVLIGDYDSCIKYNLKAIDADSKLMKIAPATSGPQSFYFGYIAHNYHMLVYGALMGGSLEIALDKANQLNQILTEDFFEKNPGTELYLESYSALDLHTMVRFGLWNDILQVKLPKCEELMLYRSAILYGSRALSYAILGEVSLARREFENFERIRGNPLIHERILHNNSVVDILAAEKHMIIGEILYREQNFEQAFDNLWKAVQLEDSFNYDEPWGRMQPIRHALGGLLLEQGYWEKAEKVFLQDLRLHPKNPWSLTGLLKCSATKQHDITQHTDQQSSYDIHLEKKSKEMELELQRSSQWADFKINDSCFCVGYHTKKK